MFNRFRKKKRKDKKSEESLVSGPQSFFDSLPGEVVLVIFSFLEIDVLMTLALVSKKINNLSSLNSLWFNFYRQVAENPEKTPRNDINYKDLLIAKIAPKVISMDLDIPHKKSANFGFYSIPNKYENQIVVTKKEVPKTENDSDVTVFLEFIDKKNYYVLKIYFPFINGSYHLAAEYLTQFDKEDQGNKWGMVGCHSLVPMQYNGCSSFEFLNMLKRDLSGGKPISVAPKQWMANFVERVLTVKNDNEEMQKEHTPTHCSIM